MSAAPPPATDLAPLGSGAMFDRIAHRYDLLNRVLSLGIDGRWRRRTVRELGLGGRNTRALDLATGTADIAIAIARQYPQCTVDGTDPSPRMLAIGSRKVEAGGVSDRITLGLGDAQQIAAADRTYDAVTIAFGIRNVPDRARALSEMARVTKLGGRVAVLELSEPPRSPLGALARLHVHHVVPWMGALLSGSKEYRYLQRSIAAFPAAADFAQQMEAAGLNVVGVHSLAFGVCHLFIATPAPTAALPTARGSA